MTAGPATTRFHAGSGNETFNKMMAGFGRDVIYTNGHLANDSFAGLYASSYNDLVFTAINGGVDTLVTGKTSKAGDALIMKGIGITAAEGAHYTYAAQSA